MTEHVDDDFWLARVPPEQQELWAGPADGPTMLAAARQAAGPDAPMPDDESPDELAAGIVWAPGAFAGVLSQHTRGSDEARAPFLALMHVVDAQLHGRLTREDVVQTYQELTEVKLATTKDISRAMAAVDRPGPEETGAYIRALAVVCGWLITRGVHRGPVRAGLAAACFLNWEPFVRCAADLGRFTELSAEACTFLANQEPARERELLELARWHTGWGRVHAVRALALATSHTPETGDWLVAQGWDNQVHAGYTAPLVAGRVDVASRVLVLGPDGTPDRDRLDSVRGLMDALLDEFSPGAHMADVPGMVNVVDQWLLALSMLPAGGIRIEDLLFADTLRTQLEQDTAGLGESFGHPDDVRVTERCSALLHQDTSRAAVEETLGRSDDPHFLAAARLAPLHGIDPLPATLDRLTRNPDDTPTWFWLAMDHRPDLGAALVDFAVRTLPPGLVTATARPPAARYELDVHMAVMALWQGPGRADPAAAWRIVEALLSSPALAARERGSSWLGQLPKAVVAPQAEALERLAGQEEDQAVHAAIGAALARVQESDPLEGS